QSAKEPGILWVPDQSIQSVSRQSILLVRTIEFAPTLNEQPDADEQQCVSDQHRDQHADLAYSEERRPKVGVQVGAIHMKEPDQQIDRQREAIHLRVEGDDECLDEPRSRPFAPGFRREIAVEKPGCYDDHDDREAPNPGMCDLFVHIPNSPLNGASDAGGSQAQGIADDGERTQCVDPILALATQTWCCRPGSSFDTSKII